MQTIHFRIVAERNEEVAREEFFRRVEKEFSDEILVQPGIPQFKRLVVNDGSIALVFDNRAYQGVCFRHSSEGTSCNFDMELLDDGVVGALFTLFVGRTYRYIRIDFDEKKETGFGRPSRSGIIIKKDLATFEENNLKINVTGSSPNPAKEIIIKNLDKEVSYNRQGD